MNPIEKAPSNPIDVSYVPAGGMSHTVKTGEDLRSIAKASKISEAELTKFNFKTTNPAEINWYLRRNVGCTQTTRDGKNWIFTTGIKPGLIYIPAYSVAAIDINHSVTIFPQPTNMTCWSAAATMLLGTSASIGQGRATAQINGGLDFTEPNMREFARGLGLQMFPPQTWTVRGLADVLERGPIMVAGGLIIDPRTGSPAPHAIVVGGISGDGTPLGTMLRVYDPWPPGVPHAPADVRYSDLMATFPQATTFIFQK